MITNFPTFHDGEMTGVRLTEDSATLYVRDVGRKNYELSLESLEALQIDDFRQGNIVHSLEVISGERPSQQTPWDRLFPSPHPTADQQYHDAHSRFLEAEVTRIEHGERSLVVLRSSYGADLLAVCRQVIAREV